MPLIFQFKLLVDSKLKDDNSISKVVPFYPILHNFSWLAPIRTEPKRTYDGLNVTYSPDGTHTSYVIKSLLSKKSGNKAKGKFVEILKKFGEDSGLFNDISINVLGKGSYSPFEIHVIINGRPHKITNVGYRVSQILPLIVEIVYENNDACFALQQPEIHLHPKGQAAFGDLVYKSASNEGKKFVIETHSDFTIDRFRLKLRKDKKEKKISSQIVFFHKTTGGNKISVIPILNNGSYSKDQPKDFKDFFIKEQLNLIGI